MTIVKTKNHVLNITDYKKILLELKAKNNALNKDIAYREKKLNRVLSENTELLAELDMMMSVAKKRLHEFRQLSDREKEMVTINRRRMQ